MSTSEEQRLARARERGWEALASLAEEACRTPLPLICEPPPPAMPFAYGDLVPLGFLLRALDVGASAVSPFRDALEDLLRDKRQGSLWAYHSGTLVTCIDSALVLQGVRDPAGIEALEIFADGRGGYFPQLCSEDPEPGKMVVTPHNRHWCQPEYGTTCLVTALRAEAGLERKTSVEYLAEVYERRSGLYFANPYMMDWALAWALQGTAPATALRGRLATDILASANEDGSFGRYDVADVYGPGDPYSGIALLRRRSRAPRAPTPGRRHDGGRPVALRHPVLFLRDRSAGATLGGSAGQAHAPGTARAARLDPGRRPRHLPLRRSTLHDKHGPRVLALTPPYPPIGRDASSPTQDRDGCHPRYRCGDHTEYIARLRPASLHRRLRPRAGDGNLQKTRARHPLREPDLAGFRNRCLVLYHRDRMEPPRNLPGSS